jgi:tRNA (guanine37-N1)-methyltransferase
MTVADAAVVAPHIAVFTLFPPLMEAFARTSLLGKAVERSMLRVSVHDLRSHATGVHRQVDDAPFGGGAGMVLGAGPVFACVEAVDPPRPLFVLTPGGHRFDQEMAHRFADSIVAGEWAGFSLLCGRYEGFDHRVHEHLADGELSVGDVVLGGGDVAAMLIIEAVARLLPGVMGNEASAEDESFSDGLLEYPQYTRPAEFRGWTVPDVLRSGDHGRIARWRRAQSIARTIRVRPDLITTRGGLTPAEQRLLDEFGLADGAKTETGPGAEAWPRAGTDGRPGPGTDRADAPTGPDPTGRKPY